MPDSFGNETPQEAIERVRSGFRAQNAQFQNSAAFSSTGAQAGQALGNIFGGAIRKTLDTRQARKSEASRLVEAMGMSLKEAKEQAKQNVPRDFTAVRKSKAIQKLASPIQKMIADLKDSGVNPTLAESTGAFMMARSLRNNGFPNEAAEVSSRATEMRNGEIERLATLDNLVARTSASRAAAEASRASADAADETSFTKLVTKGETLRTQIYESDDPEEITKLERQLGHVDAKIYKEETLVGTTAQDPSFLSKAGQNRIVLDILDADILSANLADLEDILVNAEGDYAATGFGRLTAKGIGFAENWLGRVPTESDQEFIARVVEQQGSSAFIAAEIRHALTGAAMSPAEAVFLEPFLPLPSDSRTVALMKVRVIQKYTLIGRQLRQAALDDLTGSVGQQIMKNLERQVRSDKKAAKASPTATETGTLTQTVDASVQAAIDASKAIGTN